MVAEPNAEVGGDDARAIPRSISRLLPTICRYDLSIRACPYLAKIKIRISYKSVFSEK